jgi:hypothetical protein
MTWYLVVQGAPSPRLVGLSKLHLIEADDAEGAAAQFYGFATVFEGRGFPEAEQAAAEAAGEEPVLGPPSVAEDPDMQRARYLADAQGYREGQ